MAAGTMSPGKRGDTVGGIRRRPALETAHQDSINRMTENKAGLSLSHTQGIMDYPLHD